MKTILLLTLLLALGGCSQIEDYSKVIKSPAQAGLTGYWQSVGPQDELISPQAIASLAVTQQGDTLDCRQWQRVIALPGKLILHSGDVYNLTTRRELYSIVLQDDKLHYAGMVMKRVPHLTKECEKYQDNTIVIPENQGAE